MTKQPSPKYDQLRAMREAKYANAIRAQKPVQALRQTIAAIPAKKPKGRKRRRPLLPGATSG